MLFHSGFSYEMDLSIYAPEWESLLDQPWCKYVSLDTALTVSVPSVCQILSQIPLKRKHLFTLVDIKPMYLSLGQMPCMPNWHIDTVKDPRHPSKEELHHLIVFGSGCLTEFVCQDIEIPLSENPPKDIHQAVTKEKPVNKTIEPGKLVTYGRHGIHRGVPATKAGPRLLIRITETDVFSPRPLVPVPMEQTLSIKRWKAPLS